MIASLEQITKYYGAELILDHVSLKIEDQDRIGLIGVNGAGKSTAIKMLCALVSPTDGDAILLGRSVVRQPEAVKAILGVCPQETAVAPNLTVEENLALMAGMHGLEKAQRRKQTARMVEQFGLTEVGKTRAKNLSSGFQRRLSIAMALISSPEILFLDEPTLGLDVVARRELWKIMENLKGSVTMILTTHYLEEAEALSDRIGIMAKGKLKAVGTAAELIEKTGAKNFEDAFLLLCGEEALVE